MGTPREQLAELLKQARIDAGFTSHAALARKLSVSRSVITRGESAAYPVPQDDTLRSWARTTGADLARIMDLAERARNGTPDWFASYTHAEAQAVNGHEEIRVGGLGFSGVAATSFPGWWPRVLPAWAGLVGQRDHPLAGEGFGEPV